jgi:hypothetical protein
VPFFILVVITATLLDEFISEAVPRAIRFRIRFIDLLWKVIHQVAFPKTEKAYFLSALQWIIPERLNRLVQR